MTAVLPRRLAFDDAARREILVSRLETDWALGDAVDPVGAYIALLALDRDRRVGGRGPRRLPSRAVNPIRPARRGPIRRTQAAARLAGVALASCAGGDGLLLIVVLGIFVVGSLGAWVINRVVHGRSTE